MKSLLAYAFVTTAVSALAAQPSINSASVTVSQDASRRVTVAYVLSDANAIVTAEVLTNGVPVAAERFTRVSGDINRLVAPGSRAFTWMPDRELPMAAATADFKVKLTAWTEANPPDYMVINLAVGTNLWQNAHFYVSEDALPDGGLKNDIYRTQRLVMRRIPAAGVPWTMGSPMAEWGRHEVVKGGPSFETPREVTLSQDYWMGIFEVTQRQYWYMGKQAKDRWHSCFRFAENADVRPAENLSISQLRWSANDGQYDWPSKGHDVPDDSPIGNLRVKTGGLEFDLPTEAQWEYACRAGTGDGLYIGQMPDQWDKKMRSEIVDRLGWYNLNWADDPTCMSNETHKVGLKEANRWGLYDMYGNVLELCLDKKEVNADKDYYIPSPRAVIDPEGPQKTSGDVHVCRGSSFSGDVTRCRSACASDYGNVGWPGNDGKSGNNRGFRLCCPVGTPD